MSRTTFVLLVLLAVPLPAQRIAPPQRCACASERDEHGLRWFWLAGLVLVGGALATRLHPTPISAGFVDTGLPDRVPGTLTTTETPRPPLIPLAPHSVRTVTASARACRVVAAPVPARRSQRAIQREKAWWAAQDAAARARIDRENARRRRQEEQQRRLLCLVLVPAAVPAGAALTLAMAAGGAL